MLGKALSTAAAGNAAAGEATYVEDVFSTYLYTGNGSSQTIKNGMPLGDYTGGSLNMLTDGYISSSSNINYHNSADGSFTIEGWIRRANSTTSRGIFTLGPDLNVSTGIKLLVRPDSSNRWQIFHNGGYYYTANNTIPSVGYWTHFAIVKDGTNNVLKLYVDGVEYYSASDTTSYTAQPLKIGYGYSQTYDLVGDISQFEITKEVKYTGAFTPATGPSTPGSNTELLIASGEDPSVDTSGNNYTFTSSGPVTSLSSSPFSTVITEGKGGLVWIKNRDQTDAHILVDTDRGVGKILSTNTTGAEINDSNTVDVFNSNGFNIYNDVKVNTNTEDYVSWTFAKQEKFFDVVTWTGTGGTRNISHNLNHTVGMLIMKATSTTGDWVVYHRGLANPATNGIYLDRSDADYDSGVYRNNTAPTDSVFTVDNNMNGSGTEYVAYLFAHNNGDGIFGENGDQDIIKSSAYIGNSTAGNKITVGFEPQWLLIKNASASADWYLFDVMRGLVVGGDDRYLRPNGTYSEASGNFISILPDGFQVDTTSGILNQSGNRYIYTAIRRGPMKTPESGTEVFAPYVSDATNPFRVESGFPVDSWLYGQITSTNKWFLFDRLRGSEYLKTNTTGAEVAYTAYFDDMEKASITGSGYSGYINYAFRRAPGFFDVVAYTGDGTSNRTVNHNLGVTPELWINKQRNGAGNWALVANPDNATYYDLGYLNTGAYFNDALTWTNPPLTDTNIHLQNNGTLWNENTSTYISFLFASLEGVSKVGTYTGTGAAQTVDCGFANGARFVMVKKIPGTSDWHLFDTERGIVAGNDPRLEINTTDAEDTASDYIDPASSGFALTSSSTTNASGSTYLFLAIA